MENEAVVEKESAPTIVNATATESVRPGVTPPNPLSKRQQKRQKKLLQYEKVLKEKRLEKKKRQKLKREEARSQGLPVRVGPSRKALKKRILQCEGTASKLKVAIDLDFDDLMSERDISKCVKQCLRIYTINRRSESPIELHFTGIRKNGHIHDSFKRNDGSENWLVKFHYDETHVQAFDKDNVVYLTCESDVVLQSFDENKVYVIGGLVDHNHQKGLCHDRALKAGIQTARLPLSEYVDMKTRSVLSTYHVFEILLRLNEGKSWTEAILNTLPTRKGAKPRDDSHKNDENVAEADVVKNENTIKPSDDS